MDNYSFSTGKKVARVILGTILLSAVLFPLFGDIAAIFLSVCFYQDLILIEVPSWNIGVCLMIFFLTVIPSFIFLLITENYIKYDKNKINHTLIAGFLLSVAIFISTYAIFYFISPRGSFTIYGVIHNIHATELLAIFLVMVICVVNVRITNALLNRYCS
ncbi:MAG: hypothetical protein IKZ88_07025 [Neisseriaceae bacterium]|nr:hypothetical protein [Neisseriaceae bacterium]